MGRTIPKSVSADYVVGLTDGEGCFYVLVKHSPSYKLGLSIALHFHLKMQEQDKQVLLKVRETLGCGSVYFQNEKRQNHSQCYRFTVASNKDVIEKIIPFFKKHPLQTKTKSKNFGLFCRIADIVKQKKHLTIKGSKAVLNLKSLMNQRIIGLA